MMSFKCSALLFSLFVLVSSHKLNRFKGRSRLGLFEPLHTVKTEEFIIPNKAVIPNHVEDIVISKGSSGLHNGGVAFGGLSGGYGGSFGESSIGVIPPQIIIEEECAPSAVVEQAPVVLEQEISGPKIISSPSPVKLVHHSKPFVIQNYETPVIIDHYKKAVVNNHNPQPVILDHLTQPLVSEGTGSTVEYVQEGGFNGIGSIGGVNGVYNYGGGIGGIGGIGGYGSGGYVVGSGVSPVIYGSDSCNVGGVGGLTVYNSGVAPQINSCGCYPTVLAEQIQPIISETVHHHPVGHSLGGLSKLHGPTSYC